MYFPYSCNYRSNIANITYIARHCIRTARSTSIERALLPRRVTVKVSESVVSVSRT